MTVRSDIGTENFFLPIDSGALGSVGLLSEPAGANRVRIQAQGGEAVIGIVPSGAAVPAAGFSVSEGAIWYENLMKAKDIYLISGTAFVQFGRGAT